MATYLIGSSVTQFSFATGWFLAAMGVGSYLSRNTKTGLTETFVRIQLILALVGGFSAALMFLAFAWTDTVYPVFLIVALVIGSGIGFEIPLLLRLASRFQILKVAVSDILTYDYLGALIASIIFPLIFLPKLGLIRSSLFFGGINIFAAWLIWNQFKGTKRKRYGILLSAVSIILVIGFLGAESLTGWIEAMLYQDPIIYAKQTKYQRIVITRWKDDLRLYLDGDLQFSSRDEARYHESLVHIPVSLMKREPKQVLVMGGGDGMALRELLKYRSIEMIQLVDLDDEITQLFSEKQILTKINHGSLKSPRVQVINADAFQYLKNKKNEDMYDLILIDFPDPNNASTGKLYTVAFYLYVIKHLSSEGAVVTQATSTVFSPDAFWSINRTMEEAFRLAGKISNSTPYHVYLPSFGDWGFVLMGEGLLPVNEIKPISVATNFLNRETQRTLFAFPGDFGPVHEPVINRLNEQKLLELYEKSWDRWYE